MLLKIENLRVNYGNVEALHGVNLEVNEGEIVTILGANGAGKSTTLNAKAYKEAGVDIEAGNTFVSRIKSLVASTYTKGVVNDIGGFGGLFKPSMSMFNDPVLVASTDGVGTKLKLAFMFDRHDTVGIDLVAMSVNDIIVQGAKPL